MRERGFTLLEMLAVITLIALLATLVATNIGPQKDYALRQLALTKCRLYHDKVVAWRLIQRTARVPDSLEELEVPLQPGERDYLQIEEDPWGSPFRLVREEGANFRIWSNGPDGEEGTFDDICYEPLDD